MKNWMILFLVSCLATNVSMAADDKVLSLPIYLFELKPLIYEDKGQITGGWFKSFEKLSASSHVKFEYQFMSIPRIELMLAKDRPGCNLTFLKTADRINKHRINYIFEHREKTIIKAYQRFDDQRKWDIEKLKADKSIKIISNTSVAVNALNEKGIKSDLLFNINSIIHMLLMRRIDLFVGSNIAVENMDEFKEKKLKAATTIATIVHGIGCSQSTPPEVIARLKKALAHWELREQ